MCQVIFFTKSCSSNISFSSELKWVNRTLLKVELPSPTLIISNFGAHDCNGCLELWSRMIYGYLSECIPFECSWCMGATSNLFATQRPTGLVIGNAAGTSDVSWCSFMHCGFIPERSGLTGKKKVFMFLFFFLLLLLFSLLDSSPGFWHPVEGDHYHLPFDSGQFTSCCTGNCGPDTHPELRYPLFSEIKHAILGSMLV